MWAHTIIIFFLFSCGHSKEVKFKVKLVTIQSCNIPPSLMDPDVHLNTTYTIKRVTRETTLVNFNFTIARRFGPVIFTFRFYQIRQNAQKDLIKKQEGVSCDRVPKILKAAKRQLKIKIDDDCYALPGTYHFKGLDVDDIAQIITSSMVWPGRYGYYVQFSTPKGVVSCAYFVGDLTLRK